MSVAVTLPARATRPPDVVAENDIGQRLYHTPRKELKPVKMTAPRRSRPVIVHKIGGSVLGAVVICRAPSDRGFDRLLCDEGLFHVIGPIQFEAVRSLATIRGSASCR